jgi:hypothetical protein
VATAAAVTAEDVALELVATKVALRSLMSTVIGGQDFAVKALDEWVVASPVRLLMDDEFTERLSGRADEIEMQMLEGIGQHFLAQAWRLRKCHERHDGVPVPPPVLVGAIEKP